MSTLETKENNTLETSPKVNNTMETSPKEPRKKGLLTLYKIYLYDVSGNKTNKYYYYCNKAVPAFNLYKCKKNCKLKKYLKDNNLTINSIYTVGNVTPTYKKKYEKFTYTDPLCINNLFRTSKKENIKFILEDTDPATL